MGNYLGKAGDKRITISKAMDYMHRSYDDIEIISTRVFDDMMREKFILDEEQFQALKEEFLLRLGEEGAKYFIEMKSKMKKMNRR